MKVTVSRPLFAGLSLYFVRLLDSLGYHARLRTIGDDPPRRARQVLLRPDGLAPQGTDGRVLVARGFIACRGHLLPAMRRVQA